MQATTIIRLISLNVFLLMMTACSEKSPEKTPEKKDSVSSGITRSNKTFLTDCRQLLSDAKKADSVLMGQMEIDPASANHAIKVFTDYANYCHNDSLSPVFLIKCAQVARAIGNIPEAKMALEKCLSAYPSFKNRPAALFLLAQLYDEPGYLNNEMEAKKIYQEIIDNYPKSDWAMSAKGALNFIGKSDEEIIRELRTK